ncbi:MAG: mannosyltransferase family protein [Actinomycetes bacterium]
MIWLVTRLIVLGAAAAGSWAAITGDSPVAQYFTIWRQWDTKWFESIAVYGYVGPYVDSFQDFHYNVAFFPGYPATMKLGMLAGLSPTAAGMLVSLVASLVAGFALARLTRDIGGRPELGVLAFLIAPTAVFLTGAYTEALFCAFAFWAWVFARNHSWIWAGVLAAGAALVRPNGLFLAIGLIVMFLLANPRNWKRGSALLLPFASTFGYFAYLKAITGNWMAWSASQSEYWERHLVDPVTSLLNTYRLIFTFSPTGEPSSRLVTEIAAMALLVAFTVVLFRKRMWAEATYVLVTVLSLGTSTMYHSIPRTIVVVFPAWMLLGAWMTRRRWFLWAYVAVSAPILILVTIRFTQGQWIS